MHIRINHLTDVWSSGRIAADGDGTSYRFLRKKGADAEFEIFRVQNDNVVKVYQVMRFRKVHP